MKQVVHSNNEVPERFIRDSYAKYEPLLQQPFSELYGETDDIIWDKNEEVRAEILNTCFTFTNIQCSLSALLVVQEAYGRIEWHQKEPFVAEITCLLEALFLDCHQLNKHLVDFIDNIKSSLVTRIMKDNRHIVRQICTRFEAVTEKVSHVPENTAELVESVDFVNKSQNESLPEMLQEVNAAGARLLTLLNYTMLQSKSLII